MVTRAAPPPPHLPILKGNKRDPVINLWKKNILTVEKKVTCFSKVQDGQEEHIKDFLWRRKITELRTKETNRGNKTFSQRAAVSATFQSHRRRRRTFHKKAVVMPFFSLLLRHFIYLNRKCSVPPPRDSQSCDTPDVPSPLYADVKPSPRQSHALLTSNSPSHHDFKHLTLQQIELFIVLSVSSKLFRVV